MTSRFHMFNSFLWSSQIVSHSKPSSKWGPSSLGQELLRILRRKFANLDLLRIRHFEKFDFRSDTHGTGHPRPQALFPTPPPTPVRATLGWLRSRAGLLWFDTAPSSLYYLILTPPALRDQVQLPCSLTRNIIHHTVCTKNLLGWKRIINYHFSQEGTFWT